MPATAVQEQVARMARSYIGFEEFPSSALRAPSPASGRRGFFQLAAAALRTGAAAGSAAASSEAATRCCSAFSLPGRCEP